MAKTRLTKTKRELLNLLVCKLVIDKSKEAEVTKEHKKLQSLMLKEIRKQFPSKDMKILTKYGLSSYKHDMSIMLGTTNEEGNTQYTYYHVTLDKPIELPGANSWGLNAKQKLQLTYDSECYRQYLVCEELIKDYKEYLVAKHKPYFELITAARHFEDVLEVWSEAEELRSEICGKTSLIALSPASKIAIRKDVNERKTQEK